MQSFYNPSRRALARPARVSTRAVISDNDLRTTNCRLERRILDLQGERDRAERANHAKTRFLATAGHDLRQPLQTLGILVDILRRRIEGPELQALLDRQAFALWSMRELLDTLSDMCKLDSGTLKPGKREFLIREVLDGVSTGFEGEATRRGVRLKVVPCTAMVRSDPALLRRIVESLISNAIRYTDSRRITVGCRRSGDHVRLEVWSTGKGIDPDAVAQILAGPATNNEGQHVTSGAGLGLGMSVVRQLADLLDAGMEVRSVPGRGTMLAVVLESGNVVSAASTHDRQANDYDGPPGLRVMVIEDDQQVLDAICLAISGLGLEALGARTSGEALDRLGSQELPDLLIADYDLGDKGSGIDIIRRIRQALGREIPAMLITGDGSSDSIREIEASGCRYFRKPVLVDELVAQMNRLSRHENFL